MIRFFNDPQFVYHQQNIIENISFFSVNSAFQNTKLHAGIGTIIKLNRLFPVPFGFGPWHFQSRVTVLAKQCMKTQQDFFSFITIV